MTSKGRFLSLLSALSVPRIELYLGRADDSRPEVCSKNNYYKSLLCCAQSIHCYSSANLICALEYLFSMVNPEDSGAQLYVSA